MITRRDRCAMRVVKMTQVLRKSTMGLQASPRGNVRVYRGQGPCAQPRGKQGPCGGICRGDQVPAELTEIVQAIRQCKECKAYVQAAIKQYINRIQCK